MEKDRMFKDIKDFMANMKNLDEDVQAAEFKKFSAVERANIEALEYIAADIYPMKKINTNLFKLSITFKGKKFYPVVGWSPDAAHPSSSALVPPMRRWLNGRKQYRLHNSQEDRTYILYA